MNFEEFLALLVSNICRDKYLEPGEKSVATNFIDLIPDDMPRIGNYSSIAMEKRIARMKYLKSLL